MIRLLPAAVALLALGAAPALAPLGLRAEWNFAEGSGTSSADSADGVATGTLAGGAVWTQGKIGNAVRLDGVDDYVALPANLNALRNAPGSTLAAWIRLDSLPANGAFREIFSISVNAAGPTNMSRAALAVKGDGTGADLFAGGRSTDTEGQQTLTADANLSMGHWYHVAAVVDFPADRIDIYLNGLLVATGAAAFAQGATPDTASRSAALGAQDTGDSNRFHGAIDQAKVYNRGLSASEIGPLAEEDDLRAHWAFDEGAGTAVSDSSDGNFDAVAKNGAGWTPGVMGSALDLDGFNDHVDLGAQVPLLRNVNAVTLTAWIRPASTPASGAFRELVSISVANAGPTNVSRVALALRGDGAASDVFAGGRSEDGEPQKNLTADVNLAAGSWVHVATVIDFAAKRITIYRNGLQAATAAADFAQVHTANTSSASGALGAQDAGDSNYYHGALDDVRVYASALCPCEIEQLALRDGLRAHWQFEEGTGTTAADASGHGYTGTLAGGAGWAPGTLGGAVTLDGVNGRVSLGSNLDILRRSGGATLATWVKLYSLPASGAFRELISISVNNPAGPTNVSRAALAVKGDGSAVDVFTGGRSTDTEAQQTLTADANLPSGVWRHVASTLDFRNDTLRVYVDGVLAGTGPANFTEMATPDTPSTNATLGAQDMGDSNFIHALLDDVRVYCRVLSASEIALLATPAAPAAPQNLVATPGNTSVSLSWNASPGATSYHVYRRLSGGSYGAPITNLAGTAYVDMGLTNGTTYFYVVGALNAAGESGPSNEVSATPPGSGSPPPAPVILTPSKKTNDTTPRITGTAEPNSTVTVFFNAVAEAQTAPADFAGNWTLDPAPKLEGTFSVTARAANASGNSPLSAARTIQVDTSVTAPGTPVLQVLDGRIQVSWAPSPDADVIGYEVWRKEGAGLFMKIHGGLVVDVQYCDDGLTNGVTYGYQIRAVDDTLQEGP